MSTLCSPPQACLLPTQSVSAIDQRCWPEERILVDHSRRDPSLRHKSRTKECRITVVGKGTQPQLYQVADRSSLWLSTYWTQLRRTSLFSVKEYSNRIDTMRDGVVTQRVAVVGRTAYTLKRELCYMSTAVYESCGSVIGVIKTLHWILMIGIFASLA